MAAECYPTSVRTTGHCLSAGIAKLGAFIGVYLFPEISKAFGLAGALEFAAGMAEVTSVRNEGSPGGAGGLRRVACVLVVTT